ncbi:MAG: FAD-binding oxidoreductase [Chloroflexota bacterium]
MAKYPEYDSETLQRELAGVIPAETISSNMLERINNALDCFTPEVNKDTLPYLVVMPNSAEEVSSLMKFANARKIPVFPRGSGTGHTGAVAYNYKGIVLNTVKMNHVNIYPEYGYFECGPGCRVIDVTNELSKQGYFLPIVPGSRKVASMGGIIVNNTSGHIVDSCIGKPRDYVLGLETILPTGEILETGTKSLRKPAGTDLGNYFIGGDGLLGVVTNIRMRLLPAMQNAYSVAFFEKTEDAARAVQEGYWGKTPPPVFWEFLDQESAAIGCRIQGLDPPVGHVLLAHFIGQTREETSAKVDSLHRIYRNLKPLKMEKIEDLEYWEKIWRVREVMLPYLLQDTAGVGFKGAEVVSTIPDLVDCMKACVDFSKGMPTLEKVHGYVLGHLGALTLHLAYIFPKEMSDADKIKAMDEVSVREAEINLRFGTCPGEWGQFSRFRNSFYLARYGRKNYQLVKDIKKLFDPNDILNPGVLLDDF